ncbi:MAG: DUF4177 domain-containing protein [Deltaproteobacteria bacterium]|nr:DUF4177 domain-containing protein [Deltaproteobacteria bacterium]
MKHFQYKISRHSSDELTQLVYFCSPDGQCSMESIPVNQMEKMQEILNEGGKEGWELIQVAFGKDGFVIFWKREGGGVHENNQD